MKYRVHAAEYRDTTWSEILPGTEEVLGEFDEYKDAMDCWRARTWWRVDNCNYRVQIFEVRV